MIKKYIKLFNALRGKGFDAIEHNENLIRATHPEYKDATREALHLEGLSALKLIKRFSITDFTHLQKALNFAVTEKEKITQDEILSTFETLLDKHFPKGKVKERGRAMAMIAEYCHILRKKHKGEF